MEVFITSLSLAEGFALIGLIGFTSGFTSQLILARIA